MGTREIKFRGWDKELKQWWYYSLQNLVDGIAREFPLENWCQFSGMKDVFGRDIYEGDICKQVVNEKVVTGKMVFSIDRMQFGLEAFVEDFDEDYKQIYLKRNSTVGLPEIIGNIYETPNLLKD